MTVWVITIFYQINIHIFQIIIKIMFKIELKTNNNLIKTINNTIKNSTST